MIPSLTFRILKTVLTAALKSTPIRLITVKMMKYRNILRGFSAEDIFFYYDLYPLSSLRAVSISP